jgi:hypothetical protein
LRDVHFLLELIIFLAYDLRLVRVNQDP